MGFLSRKKKNQQPAEAERLDRAAAVAEETHPIVEELEQMEQAVPERRFDRDSYEEDGYEDEHEAGERAPAPQSFEEHESFEEEPEAERPVNAEQTQAVTEHEEEEDEDD